MSSLSGVLERYRLQTLNLPPDKLVHTLIPAQTGAAEATSVLDKKKSGSAGRLGGGSFGAVHLESSESDCEAAPKLRAVKTISKAVAQECSVLWQQEVENLIVLSKFPELFVNIFGWWEDDKSIYLPMEYFEAGDLSRYREYIRDENEIRTISHQIALGLEKMHALGIIHRDLKPQNVFVATLQPAWKVKIGDFGFSKRISASVSAPYTICGTTKYMAPEYADPSNNRESSDFTAAVDMWSFGCLIYELFVHKCPFEEEDNSLKRYIKHKVFPRQPLERIEASNESIWLISKLLEPDPDRRLPAEDALKCAWFDVQSKPATDSQIRRKPVKPLKSTPDASPKLQANVEPAPLAFVVSVATDDENQTAVSSVHALHRPELSERAITVPTMTLDHVALVPDESIPKPSVPPPLSPRLPPRPKSTSWLRADAEKVHASVPPLSPRLPPRPKSSNALRLDAEKVHAKPHLLILPHDDPETSAVEVEVIKPDIIEMPKSSCPMPAKSRRTVIPVPSLRSTKKGDNCVDMDFKDLPLNSRPKPMCDMCEARRVFNPVIKPAALYFCKDCDHRPLCARCIRETIHSSGDPHEADHKLQAWIQGHILPFASFSKNSLAMTTLESGLEADYGRSWMSSDRAFVPPTGGQLTTRFTMYAPPGEYKVSIDFRTLKCGEAIRSSTIGHYNAMIVKKAKAVKLGSILLGAQTVEKLDSPAKEDPAHSRYLPEHCREHEVTFTEEEDPQTVTLGRLVRVEPDRLLEVHIRGSYDSVFFKAGSPFKWWLDEISILHTGSEEHVASMGDRKMREDFKKQQARVLKSQKIQKNMGLVSQSIDVAGKVGKFIPGARYLSNVASGAVKLSATAMKDPQGKNQGMHSAPQIVHYHYAITNDTPSSHQWQQQESEYEEQPECEEPDDQGYYAEEMTYCQEQVECYQEDEEQPQLMEEVAGANAGDHCHSSNLPGGGVSKTVSFSNELTPRREWTFKGPNFFLFPAAIRTYCWPMCAYNAIKHEGGPAADDFNSVVRNLVISQAIAQHGDGSIGATTRIADPVVPPKAPKIRLPPTLPAGTCGPNGKQFYPATWPTDILDPTIQRSPPSNAMFIVAEPDPSPPRATFSHSFTTCGRYCSAASDCGPGDPQNDYFCANAFAAECQRHWNWCPIPPFSFCLVLGASDDGDQWKG